MTLKNRKMNNYSFMRISTVFVLVVALVTSTFAIPFVPRTGAEPLTPPDIPSNPDPANDSKDVLISAKLSWICDDPDNDTVTYDVYFGTTSPPVNVAEDYPNMSYNPGLMNYSTKYYWQIIAWDTNNESRSGPQWVFTTEDKVNNPPNIPSNPVPTNGSTGISISSILSWTGGDPDNDTVKYDVYFGNTSTPPNVSNNQSSPSYNPSPDLSYNTMYYWKIVAWDINNASTVGPLWHFTTGQEGPISVTITKPAVGKFYFNDAEKSLSLGGMTIVYGKITITVNVTSEFNITKIEYFVDDDLISEENTSDLTCFWQPLIQFNRALSLKRTIKVIVYDSEGNNASANITITKWRFHPLPWIIAGMAIASRLVLHTTVVGLFYNVQESRFSVSFYAIRAHYKTVGPFQMRKGNIHFKHCTGGVLIGPTTLTKMGLFHKFAIGSFTFIGNVNADKIGLGGSLLSRILQRRAG
ncbi:MAG TPA: Ig-like domain-containing protein [Candidatus Thermoplasmatota archaeon]|nr:Ig-like domain-containing protein [Candidatus Thermoplasmatota archaeon]